MQGVRRGSRGGGGRGGGGGGLITSCLTNIGIMKNVGEC